jgi:hypothetical protein
MFLGNGNVMMRGQNAAPSRGTIVDRARWQFGRTPINLIFVGAALGKMCFPLA